MADPVEMAHVERRAFGMPGSGVDTLCPYTSVAVAVGYEVDKLTVRRPSRLVVPTVIRSNRDPGRLRSRLLALRGPRRASIPAWD